jgi:hypothetical protein
MLERVFGKVDSTFVVIHGLSLERVKVLRRSQFSIDGKCKTLKHRGKE